MGDVGSGVHNGTTGTRSSSRAPFVNHVLQRSYHSLTATMEPFLVFTTVCLRDLTGGRWPVAILNWNGLIGQFRHQRTTWDKGLVCYNSFRLVAEKYTTWLLGHCSFLSTTKDEIDSLTFVYSWALNAVFRVLCSCVRVIHSLGNGK